MEVQAVPREPERATPAPLDSEQTVVLVFGSPGAEERAEAKRELQVAFPQARILGCSTPGVPSTTAVRFRRVGMRSLSRRLPASGPEAVDAVAAFTVDLARAGPNEAPPALVLVFARRATADAGAWLQVVRSALPEGTTLAGGVAGGAQSAWVLSGDSDPVDDEHDCIVGIALHGRDLLVHQHVASRPGPERAGGAAVSLAIGRGAEPPGNDARIVVGGLVPMHGLAEAPGYDDAVITTVHERPAFDEDFDDDFDDVETQVTHRPRPPPPPVALPVSQHPAPPQVHQVAAPTAATRPPGSGGVERLGFFVAGGWSSSLPIGKDSERTLLLVRGTAGVARDSRALRQLARLMGRSHTVGWCGPTADRPSELAFEVQLARFEHLGVRACSATFEPGGDPEQTGRRVAAALQERPGLVAVLGVSATPPHAPSRHQAGLMSLLGEVPLIMVHSASPDRETTWAYDGTRIAGAMLVGVGLYREGLPIERIAALAKTLSGQAEGPVEGFWRLALRLDPAVPELPPAPERHVVAQEETVRPPPDFEAILANEATRAPQSDGVAPAANRPGPATVPSSNASATPVPAPTASPPPPPVDPAEGVDDGPRPWSGADKVPPPPDDADDTVEVTQAPVDPGAHRLEIAERQRPGAQTLDVRVREIDGVSVVTLTGPIDTTLDPEATASRVGNVVMIDLDGVDGLTSAGLTAWHATLAALDQRGATTFLVRCSEALVAEETALRGESGAGATLVSMFAPYRCGACGTAFSALYDVREPGVLRALGASTVPCPSCEADAGLDADPERYAPLAARAARTAPAVVVAIANGLPMREGPDLSPAPSGTASGPPPRAAAPPAVAPALLVVGGGVALVAALVISLSAAMFVRWLFTAEPSTVTVGDLAPVATASAPPPPTSGAEGTATSLAVDVIPPLTLAAGSELPPAWVETRLGVGADNVLAVGRSTGPDGAAALERARLDAVLALIQGMAEALQRAPAWAVIEPSMRSPLTPEEEARAVARFEAHLGPSAPVVRDRTWSREASGQVEVAARYSLDRSAWDRLLAAYSEVAEFRTIRVGLLFPTMAARLPGDGQLVVLQTDDWEREARVGDVVVAVERQPVRAVSQFEAASQEAWRQGSPGRSVDVQVVSNGIERDLRFFRKAGSAGKSPSFQGRPLASPR